MHPERLGPYRILGLLGRGGLGVVYRAVDERTDEVVAVKLLTGTSAGNRRAAMRFAREFQSLTDLDHPNVVRVIDAGLAGEVPFFAMEFIDGLDVKRYLDQVVSAPSLGRLYEFPAPVGPASQDSHASHVSRASQVSRVSPSSVTASRSGTLSAAQAFDMDAWLEEPDSDVLMGREDPEPESAEFGAIGPAPSIDLPAETWPSELEPIDLPSPQDISQLNHPLRVVRLGELLTQVCHALAYIHSRGLVHRDLKPSNILVDEDGDARLMDFGLCKSLTDENDVTETGQVVGTYRYMSPEQASGEPLDARSDLYSLGVILYELLAGRPPFIAKHPLDLWHELLETEPPAVMTFNAGVDMRLAHIAHALLHKDPFDRLQTAEEVIELLGD